MPWARFADDYLGNPKLAGLSTVAIALDVTSIIYSARDLRDGHLTTSDVQVIATLIHLRRWQPVVGELVDARRWTPTAGGWDIHDYLDYQPSREKVLAERAAATARRRDVRANVTRTSGEHSGYVRPDVIDPVPGPGPEGSVDPLNLPSATGPADADVAPPRVGTPRENGTNPRASGTNPRALGTNPRAVESATDDNVAIVHADVGICPLCRLPYQGPYIDHTAEKHRVNSEAGPGNLGGSLPRRRRTPKPDAPPPEFEAEVKAAHERLQAIPEGSP